MCFIRIGIVMKWNELRTIFGGKALKVPHYSWFLTRSTGKLQAGIYCDEVTGNAMYFVADVSTDQCHFQKFCQVSGLTCMKQQTAQLISHCESLMFFCAVTLFDFTVNWHMNYYFSLLWNLWYKTLLTNLELNLEYYDIKMQQVNQT